MRDHTLKRLGLLGLVGIAGLLVFFVLEIGYAQENETLTKKREQAIVILKSETLREMQLAREEIEKMGGRVISIFPPDVIWVQISKKSARILKEEEFIKEITFNNIAPADYYYYNKRQQEKIEIWNKVLEQKKELKKLKIEELLPFQDVATFPPHLPLTVEEREEINKQYIKRWNENEGQIKREHFERHGILYEASEGAAPSSDGLGETQEPASSPETPFGRATGAGYYDTSLYMAGDIAVGVFFAPGNGGSWTPGQINDVFSSIVEALNQFWLDEPNAHITFIFVNEGQTELPSNQWDYINDLRNLYNSHWAYMIEVIKGTGVASAGLFGPSHTLYSEDLRDGYVVRHETCHIFGALDQYASGWGGPTARSGYLGVVNANSKKNDGSGYFYGAGEGLSDIMVSGMGIDNPFGVYTRGQLGWRDSNGNGILEPLDTIPDTQLELPTGTYQFMYSGIATDIPMFNESQQGLGDVTLNTIDKVEYRINGLSWQEVLASDGEFDSGVEPFVFTTPELSDGSYLIETRAINSVGNIETSYAQHEVTVTDSPVSNVEPFAYFSVMPKKGSLESLFSLDASESSDLEDEAESLEVRWDFDNDGNWDTGWSVEKTESITYDSGGLKTILLEVKDQEGLISSVSQEVFVDEFNQSPHAFFVVDPENAHGHLSQGEEYFEVTLDASGSQDAEDSPGLLLARWDFEDDGVWDTPYSNQLSQTHAYPLEVAGLSFFSGVDTFSQAHGVAISGSYAYVLEGYSSDGALVIIDISAPENPIRVAQVSLYHPNDVAFYENYAYVVTNGYSKIFDISEPTAPVWMGNFNASKSIAISNSFAYTAGYEEFQVFDLSDPINPVIIGSVDIPSYMTEIAVSGSYAYVVENYVIDGVTGLQVINISDPTNPFIEGFVETPGDAYDVAISGTYAYVTDEGSGLQVINISDPTNPVIVGSVETPNLFAHGIAISNSYAYVADGGAGLQVIDITDPENPIYLWGARSPGGGARDVAVVNNYAYVANSNDFSIFEILSEPTVAARSSHWRSRLEIKDTDDSIDQTTRDVWAVTYNHNPVLDDFVVSFEDVQLYSNISNLATPGESKGFSIDGSYAYVADGYSGLQVIDISVPENPVNVGSIDTYFASDVAISGTYAYVADIYLDLRIINISEPTNPIFVGSTDLPGYAANAVAVSGDYAYVIDLDAGLQVIDISIPTNPVPLGSADTPGSARGIAISNPYAYIADGGAGLQIFDISDSDSPVYIGNYDTLGSARDVFVDSPYAYIADGGAGLQILDISDPTDPINVGSSDLGLTVGSAISICVVDTYAYVAATYSGLKIVDVSNPANPTLIGTATFPGFYASSVAVSPPYLYGLGALGSAGEGTGLNVFVYETTPSVVLGSIYSNDADLETTWDGFLQYRLDLDNDSFWDTSFAPEDDLGSIRFIIPAGIEPSSKIIAQVRDRFSATASLVKSFPILEPIGDKSGRTGGLITFTVTATDEDMDPYLELVASPMPEGAQMIATQDYTPGFVDAIFLWTPSYNQVGVWSITFTVTDSQGLEDSETIDITVSSGGGLLPKRPFIP